MYHDKQHWAQTKDEVSKPFLENAEKYLKFTSAA